MSWRRPSHFAVSRAAGETAEKWDQLMLTAGFDEVALSNYAALRSPATL